jgi:hypothetical protein
MVKAQKDGIARRGAKEQRRGAKELTRRQLAVLPRARAGKR